jgi:hypothetical protein
MHHHLLPTALYPEDGEDGDGGDRPGHADLEVEAIEVQVDQIQLRQGPLLPGLHLRLEPLHDPADRALGQGTPRQQRLERPPDPARVGPAEIHL